MRLALVAAVELTAGLTEREASHIAIFDLGSSGQTEAAIAAVNKHLTAWPCDALVISIAANPNGLIGGSGRLGQKHQIAELMDSVAPHRSSRRAVVCRGRPMQRPFCPGDVRCPRTWAGCCHLTAHRRLPFGHLAAEPRVPGEGTCGSPADRRRHRRGLRRRVAARGVTKGVSLNRRKRL